MTELPRPSLGERVRLHVPTARRSLRRHGLRPLGPIGRLRPDLVFVVGCPRSGTTFTGEAIGAAPGFFDLGEVNRLKAVIPALHQAVHDGLQHEVVDELRRILRRSQRVAGATGDRAVEQTPECSFVVPQLAEAFPHAQFVHLVRDGRDVVVSLLERGWLSHAGRADPAEADAAAIDDAGLPLGQHARFWVEPGRELEFERSSEVRRCAWAWRRYESTAAAHLAELDPHRVVTVRYEDMAADPAAVATRLGESLGASPVDAFAAGFSGMHASSVKRYEQALTSAQLDEVEAEAGSLLDALGYRAG